MVASLGDKVYQSDIPPLPDNIKWITFANPPKYVKTVKIAGDNSIIGAATSNITSAGGGIISIKDITGNWNTVNAPDFPFSSIEITPKDTIAATYGIGAGSIKVYTKSPYKPKNKGMAATSINKIFYGDGTILTATEFSGLFKSVDGGKTWDDISKNLFYESIGGFLDAIINKTTGTTFTATVSGTYRLPRNDTSWQNINFAARTIDINNLGTVFFGNGANIGYSDDDGITINKTFVNNILNINNFAFRKDTVFISTDNGVYTSVPKYTNWSLDGLLGVKVSYAISVDDSWSYNECLKNIDLIAGTNSGKIYLRYNNGQYTEYAEGLNTGSNITSIALVPKVYDSNQMYGLYLANPPQTNLSSPFPTSSKYDFSTCNTWTVDVTADYKIQDIISASPNESQALLKGEQAGQYVLYGTLGTGILRRDLTTDVKNKVVNIPSEFSLKQNYPNPFNPSTIIQFDLPKELYTKLEIYNALGEKVTTLVSEKLAAGKHKYEWNAEGMPSGIYFYRLNTEKFTKTDKMLLLK